MQSRPFSGLPWSVRLNLRYLQYTRVLQRPPCKAVHPLRPVNVGDLASSLPLFCCCASSRSNTPTHPSYFISLISICHSTHLHLHRIHLDVYQVSPIERQHYLQLPFTPSPPFPPPVWHAACSTIHPRFRDHVLPCHPATCPFFHLPLPPTSPLLRHGLTLCSGVRLCQDVH